MILRNAGVVRALSCILCLVLLAVVVPEAGSEAAPRRFRIVVYDYRQSLDDTASYAAYHANLERQVAAAANHFSADPPTLALLPENTGLMAWFVRDRGARVWATDQKERSVTEIAVQQVRDHLPQIGYYLSKCHYRIPLERAILLALTDTAWRAFGEGIAALAAQYHIWIMASLNAPDISVTTDPQKVSRLADRGQWGRGYAYEGGCELWNTAFLFRPDAPVDRGGQADPKNVVAAARKKVYLVKAERDQSLGGLALSSESPANARIIELPPPQRSAHATPLARLGVLTSKDAWMPDIVERLEIDGMEVFLQPEAGAWAATTVALPPCLEDQRKRDARPNGQSGWPLDVMTRAIWSMVQWQAETSWGALSDLTGDFGTEQFDGTATITRDARRGEAAERYLLGRPPQPGIVDRRPWVFSDPPSGVSMEDVQLRRRILDAEGSHVKPSKSRENRNLEGFLSVTVKLPPLGPVGERLLAGRPSVSVAPGEGAQWEPALAAGPDGAIYATWTDLRGGFEAPYLARSTDSGASWSNRPVRAGDSNRRPFDQQANQYDAKLAVTLDGTLHLVWADFRNQSWDIYAARSRNSWRAWRRSVRVDHSRCSQEKFPGENHDQEPVVAPLPDGALVAAWSDARGTRAERNIMVARLSPRDRKWKGDVQADGSGHIKADQWSPAIAASADGKIAVAWQDHREGWNQIFMAFSRDGGRRFDDAIRVAPSTTQQWQPAIAFDSDGGVGVAWSEGIGGGERRIRVKVVKVDQPTGQQPAILADAFPPPGVRQARPAIVYARGGFWVAWQDERAGDWDVLVARVNGVGSRPLRVDDGPPGTHARLPALVVAGDHLVAAWEDTRNGTEQIRTAVLPLK